MQEGGDLMKVDIIVCGVGGQGNLLASVAIAQYAMDRGYNVLGTETIGAAQRGGSVVSHLRVSTDKIYSPLVPQESADILMGFEPVEALRNIKLVNNNGQYLVNTQKVPTVNCNMGLDTYPEEEEIIKNIQEKCPKGYIFNATKEAQSLGNTQMTNVIMLGALARMSPFFDKEEFGEIVIDRLPEKVREINRKAFQTGYDLICK
jgi:indolepyruvate ferredoxin oxidoreductase beta subunit